MLKKLFVLFAFLFSTALALAAVDANKATEAELDSVKGIGPVTSKEIVAERKKGDFKDWADFISRVKGLGEKRAGHLSDAGLTVGGQSYKPAATTTAKKDEKAPAAAKDDKSAMSAKASDDGKKADKKADAMKADAKKEAKDAKADAKAETKEAKAEAKKEKADAKAEAKQAKADAKADAKKAAASDKK